MKCSPTTGKTNLNRLTSERAKKTKANENQIFVNVTKQLNFAKKIRHRDVHDSSIDILVKYKTPPAWYQDLAVKRKDFDNHFQNITEIKDIQNVFHYG